MRLGSSTQTGFSKPAECWEQREEIDPSAPDGKEAWRIDAVPVTHDRYTDVANTLREAGLNELEFCDNHHSPKPPETTMACRTWVVRAEAPGDITSFEVVHNVSGQDTMMYAFFACALGRAKPVSALPSER